VRISTLRAVPGWIGSTLSYGGYGLAIAIYMTFVVAAYQDDAGFGPRMGEHHRRLRRGTHRRQVRLR
jgi:hypothetical protein